MKKKILNTIIIVFALISVIANFYQPLRYEPEDSDQVNLTINVHDDNYQPLFISKRRGITEIINAKFEISESEDIIKIEKIFFNTNKLSGLMSHGIKNIALDTIHRKDKNGKIIKKGKIIIDMRLFSGKEKETVSLSNYSQEIQDCFYIDPKNPREIITIAYFDCDREIEKIIEKLKNKHSTLTPKEKAYLKTTYLDKTKGSICNFNAIYE